MSTGLTSDHKRLLVITVFAGVVLAAITKPVNPRVYESHGMLALLEFVEFLYWASAALWLTKLVADIRSGEVKILGWNIVILYAFTITFLAVIGALYVHYLL